MKLVSVAALKYSSPMLRPPTTAIRPSAIQALLCIRRFTLTIRNNISSARAMPPLRLRVGLNIRTSMFGCASGAARIELRPRAY